jgi:transcription termination factor NusB
MDAANLLSLVEHLEDNVDELEENLEPLLSAALTTTTQKLPLLDKAKLYVLIVYSIESLLFCKTDPLPIVQALIAHSLSTTQWSQGERSPSL